MNAMNRILSALRNLFRREHIERDLDAEVRSYVLLLEEEKMSRGMNPEAARRAARIEMIGPDQLKEEVRSVRAGAWIESLWQDLRFGARMLRKNPGFTAVAILTLALGIGANTAVFSVVDTVVLKPLPYKDSPRLVNVLVRVAMFSNMTLGTSWIGFQDIRKEVSAFEQVAAYRTSNANLTQQGDPARISVGQVSDGFFDELGVTPQLGRLILASDLTPGQENVAILSDALWRTRFGADPGVIGRSITLDKKEYTIVGVASKTATVPSKIDVWSPLDVSPEERLNPLDFDITILAKLRKGETIAHAAAQLNTIGARIRNSNDILKQGYDIFPITLLNRRVQGVRSAYLMLFGAASFVLLIACANLASLLLSRGWGRQREMAVRAALGASKSRIIRQGLVESCLLALLGGIGGAFLAVGGVNLFHATAPAETPRLDEVSVDPRLFLFALTSAVFAGIIFGLAPALRASRLDPQAALRDGASGGIAGTGSSRQLKLGGLLVVMEIAMAFVLLIGSLLATRSLMNELHQETGLRTDHLLTMDLPQTDSRPELLAAQNEKMQQLVSRIHGVPGVEEVALTDHSILGGGMSMTAGLVAEGEPPTASPMSRVTYQRYASPEFFTVMGMRLIRGRLFNERDIAGSTKIAVVNVSMALQFWGSTDVVGKRIGFGGPKGQTKWIEVAGVVADVREVSPTLVPQPLYYLPIFQNPMKNYELVVRTSGNPDALGGAVSRAVWDFAKDQPITNVSTVEHTIAVQTGDSRLQAVLLNVFAGIGLALALLGVYGVVAYSVARRTREIGIRVALGARRGQVLRMVIRQGFVLAVIGVAIGVGAGLGLSRVMAGQLYGVEPTDPATYIGGGTLVIIVACLACYVPARRAMRVDPMVALRHE